MYAMFNLNTKYLNNSLIDSRASVIKIYEMHIESVKRIHSRSVDLSAAESTRLVSFRKEKRGSHSR